MARTLTEADREKRRVYERAKYAKNRENIRGYQNAWRLEGVEIRLAAAHDRCDDCDDGADQPKVLGVRLIELY